MLPQKAIAEFKQLYKNKFGVVLSEKEASYRANNLFGLYAAVYGKNNEKITIKNSSVLLGNL